MQERGCFPIKVGKASKIRDCIPALKPCLTRSPKGSEMTTMPRVEATENRMKHKNSRKDSEGEAVGRKARVNALRALTSNTQPPRNTLPFPPEIRLKVLGYLFDRSYKIGWRPSDSKTYPDSLNILQVSSTVHQEAYEVLYDMATFKFHIGDMFRYRKFLRTAYEDIATKMIPRIKHASVIFWHLSPNSARYQQVSTAANELVRAVTRNTRLRSLELVMNENGLQRLTTMEALQFLNWAIPTKIHVKGPYACRSRQSDELNHTRAKFDKFWSMFLRKLEDRNGPIEVETVAMGEDDESVRPYFEATLRLKKVSTRDASTTLSTNPMRASLALGESS